MGRLGADARTEKAFFHFLYESKNLTEQVVENLKEQWKVPDEISNSQLVTALIPDMLRLLFQKNFGYADCFMLGNSISENAIKRSPFVLALADSIGEFLSHKADLKINEYNTQLLGVSYIKYSMLLIILMFQEKYCFVLEMGNPVRRLLQKI